MTEGESLSLGLDLIVSGWESGEKMDSDRLVRQIPALYQVVSSPGTARLSLDNEGIVSFAVSKNIDGPHARYVIQRLSVRFVFMGKVTRLTCEDAHVMWIEEESPCRDLLALIEPNWIVFQIGHHKKLEMSMGFDV